MKRLERLMTIAFFLAARRRVLARDVAEQFGISLRTVYRDVRALERAGFPIEGSAGDGYRVTQDAFLRPLSLTTEEAEALLLAAQALGASVDQPLYDALTRATIKLEAALDRPARRKLKALGGRVVVPAFARRESGPSAKMLAAIRGQRVAAIAYRDTRHEGRTARTIEPLGLVCLGDAWWLLACCRLRQDARAFRVDRIESWRDADETFAPRGGFSFAELVARDGHLGQRLFGYRAGPNVPPFGS